MQDAVDQQSLEFFAQGMTSPLGLASRGLKRDYHISQQSRLEGIGEWKRQHVSRFVFPPILTVQGVDLAVRH